MSRIWQDGQDQGFDASSTGADSELETQELGEETDGKMAQAGRWRDNSAVDPEHSNVDPDEEAARNRNTLLSYFNDIASIPTLTKEQEVMLAKEMEAATFEMRSGILAVPFTWREAVDIWRGLQGENRVTAKMSEGGKGGAAELLGVRPTTLADRVRTHGIKKPVRR